jgi:hypothetical protein
MTKISTTTHPNLTPAERRALRARTEAGNYTLQFATIRLRRNGDGKVGSIRICYVRRPGAYYTVRLNRDGAAVHCNCPDFTRRIETEGAAAQPCKHGLLAQSEAWPQVSPAIATLAEWAQQVEAKHEAERLARAEADRALLWPD